MNRPGAGTRSSLSSFFRNVLTINRRNVCYTLTANERRLYPIVDCKLLTKKTLAPHKIPMPETYCEITNIFEARHVWETEEHDEFVVKPARGSQGHGIMIITGREGDSWRTVNGEVLSQQDFEYYLYNILSGLYSLGGMDDKVYLEYLVKPHPLFKPVSYRGIPDIRVVLYQGIPVMSMLRLPTKRSRGKANLHQGAVGAGIELLTGKTSGGVCGNSVIDLHPDTRQPIAGIVIPFWEQIIGYAMKVADIIELGYFGIDFVIDVERGPLMLELNARPGLAIQIANRRGLRSRLEYVDSLKIKTRPDFDQRREMMGRL